MDRTRNAHFFAKGDDENWNFKIDNFTLDRRGSTWSGHKTRASWLECRRRTLPQWLLCARSS